MTGPLLAMSYVGDRASTLQLSRAFRDQLGRPGSLGDLFRCPTDRTTPHPRTARRSQDKSGRCHSVSRSAALAVHSFSSCIVAFLVSDSPEWCIERRPRRSGPAFGRLDPRDARIQHHIRPAAIALCRRRICEQPDDTMTFPEVGAALTQSNPEIIPKLHGFVSRAQCQCDFRFYRQQMPCCGRDMNAVRARLFRCAWQKA